jgi:hypothetical protein
MKYIFVAVALFFSMFSISQTKVKNKDYFELKVYEYKTSEQERMIDQFLSQAYLPYLHKKGIKQVGVFTNIANDTATIKKLFVLIPHKNISDIPNINKAMFADMEVVKNGKEYLDATSEQPAFDRIVGYVLEGFRFAPTLMMPKLKSPSNERVYELRSYESASEKKYWKKVEMFNEGGEIDLFARLNFNAVFYAEVVSGPTMPNLMYMTSFENMEDRNAHWKAFSNDPKWKELLSMKEYEKTVSKNVTLFLRAKPYSDY